MKIRQGNFVFDTKTKKRYPILLAKTICYLRDYKPFKCLNVVYKDEKGKVFVCFC